MHIIRLAKHSFQLNCTLFDQAIVSGTNFLTGIILARALGFKAYGVFTLLWFLVLFLYTLYESFFATSLMTLTSYQLEKMTERRYYGCQRTFAMALAILAALVSVVALVGIHLFDASVDIMPYALPLVLSVLGYLLQDSTRRLFFVRRQVVCAVCIDTLRYGSQLAVLILFLMLGTLTIEKALWVIAICALVSYGLFWFMLPLPSWHWSTLSIIATKNWHFAKWLMGAGILQWFSSNLLIILSGSMLGAFAVGLLRAMQNIVAVLYVILQGLDNFIPARAVQAFRQSGFAAMERFIGKAALGMLAIFLIIAIPCLVMPDQVLHWIYGHAYHDGYGNVLRLYLLIYLMVVVNKLVGYLLQTIQYNKPQTFAYLPSVVVSTCAGYWMILHWGLWGVAIGLIIHVFLLFSIMSGCYLKRRASMVKVAL